MQQLTTASCGVQYAFAGQTKLSHFDSRSIYVTGGPLRKARGGGRNEMAAAFGAGRWRLDAARSNRFSQERSEKAVEDSRRSTNVDFGRSTRSGLRATGSPGRNSVTVLGGSPKTNNVFDSMFSVPENMLSRRFAAEDVTAVIPAAVDPFLPLSEEKIASVLFNPTNVLKDDVAPAPSLEGKTILKEGRCFGHALVLSSRILSLTTLTLWP